MLVRTLGTEDPNYFRNFETRLGRGFRRGLFAASLMLRRIIRSNRPVAPPDWIHTPHSIEWARDPDFAAAYRCSVQSVGEDFRIPWRIQTLTWAVSQTNWLQGEIVELGTGRGFSMAAVRAYMESRGMRGRGIWCFDAFLPHSVSELGDERHSFAYAREFGLVSSVFNQWPDVRLVKGDVRDTLDTHCPEKISLLHIDLNDPEVESWALRTLWDRLERGAIVVLDDFANLGMEQSERAMNEVSRDLGFSLLSLPSGQGLFIRT